MKVELTKEIISIDGKQYPVYYVTYSVLGVNQKLKVRVNENERTLLDAAIKESQPKK